MSLKKKTIRKIYLPDDGLGRYFLELIHLQGRVNQNDNS